MKRTSLGIDRKAIATVLIFFAWNGAFGEEPFWLGTDSQLAAESAIRNALDGAFQANYVETPLSDVLADISRQGNISVLIDNKALEDAGCATDMPISKSLRNISIRSALDLVLKPIDLSWIMKDESLLITTVERANAELRLALYPVQDIVTNPRGADYDSLIDMITTSVAPTTWDEVGGPGTITPFRASGVLVISQTREIHEQTVELLELLRKVRDFQGIEPPPITSTQTKTAPITKASAEPSRRVVIPAETWMIPRTHE